MITSITELNADVDTFPVHPQRAEWSILIGPDLSRNCALIGWDQRVATPALLCHKDTVQLGDLLAFRWFFMVWYKDRWPPCTERI